MIMPLFGNSPVVHDTLVQLMNRLIKICCLFSQKAGTFLMIKSCLPKKCLEFGNSSKNFQQGKWQMGQMINAAMNGRDVNVNALSATNQKLT